MSFSTVKLKDVVQLAYGKSLPERDRKPGDVPVYGSGGVGGTHNQALVEGPGIILGRKGTIGSVYYEKRDFFPIDTVYYVKPLEDTTDLRYLYYLLKSLPLKSLNTDAAVPGLNRDIAYDVKIALADPAVQQEVVRVLEKYDDLIENNRRRIQLLEESARLLYKEWFVHLRFPGHEHVKIKDGVPEGWEPRFFSEVIEVNPKTVVEKSKEITYVPMSSLSESDMTVNEADFELREKHTSVKFKKNDVLLARITPCLENGKTAFVYFLGDEEVACGSTEFIVMRAKDVSPPFVYCLCRSYPLRQKAIKSMIGSSGRQRVQASCFDDFPVPLPPSYLLEQFDEVADRLFGQIAKLMKLNQKLSQARDILLPRLMSGELVV